MSARAQLQAAGQFDRETAALCGQKVPANLNARIKDWESFSKGGGIKGNFDKRPTGYHKPGSNKK